MKELKMQMCPTKDLRLCVDEDAKETYPLGVTWMMQI